MVPMRPSAPIMPSEASEQQLLRRKSLRDCDMVSFSSPLHLVLR